MEDRIKPWLEPHLDRRPCAQVLSDTVGTPNTRTPPDFFGIGTAFTGG